MSVSPRSRIDIPVLVVDTIIRYVYNNCEKVDKSGFCKSTPCVHANSLYHCLPISKQWFIIVSRHLWRRYATLKNLLNLLKLDSNGCVSGLFTDSGVFAQLG